VCNACGSAYADALPEQDVFDRYYAEMSKYEYSSGAGQPTPSDRARFRQIVDLVKPHARADQLLLDIGCATGGLLAEFKADGFHRVLGVDPSPVCVRLACELHGVPARVLPISELGRLSEKADIGLLTGVLEHLRDVDASLGLIKEAISPNGMLYIEVPDASRYDRCFSAPYNLLSMEHVNYFSPTSLETLMARHGFAAVFIARVERNLSPNAVEPAIAGLFRISAGSVGSRDEETRPALERYLAQSAALEERVHHQIAGLAASGVPLAVWGAGTHTLRLLKTSDLSQANLTAFIDSNTNYHGKRLLGRPVLSPAAFAGNPADILISTHVAEEAIWAMISGQLYWPNRVHRLYHLENCA